MIRLLSTRIRKRLAATLVTGFIGFLWGLMLLHLNLGQGLRRASYDLPFAVGEHPPPQDVVMIYLDEASHNDLDQPLSLPWDRRLHARLIDRLVDSGARMIVFDILFHDENPDQDGEFAAAIKRHGNVVLAGERVRNESESAQQENLLLPAPDLRRAAAGWGLTAIPMDPDGVVRQVVHSIPTDFGEKPSLSEWVRRKAQPSMSGAKAGVAEFINYYGPPATLTGYSYGGVLLDRSIPDDAFRDKIVVVGARQKSGLSVAGKDSFATPYSQVRRVFEPSKEPFTSGLEIHATLIANLLDGRSFKRLGNQVEIYQLLISAFALAAAACLLSPAAGLPLCATLAAAITVTGVLCHQTQGYLFFWTLPAFGQFPLIAGLSLGAHYLIEYSARWRLRRAFKSYMSEEQARQIDEEAVSLDLGGKEVEATILFSDLAGFTSMSEGLPPQAVSKALISYFERATEGILDNRGTIIKYIGDAVLATWGVPVKVDREADRAIDAAIQMQLASTRPIALESVNGVIEQVLETRIGINTGTVLAGNLGSRRRFDYTVIGDAVNTAARLEGLNKMLGTSILVSESVLAKCAAPGKFLTRRMGSFVVKGKKQPTVVFEILGHAAVPEANVRDRSRDYLDFYQQGIAASVRGDRSSAQTWFHRSLLLHDRLPECPASRLHLDAIEASCRESPSWSGVILLDSK